MREQLSAALQPLVSRCYQGTCWKKTADGPRNIGVAFDPAKLNEHAAGVSSYGLATITPGTNTTRVALLDFDSHQGETTWHDMQQVALCVIAVLDIQGYTPVVFKSSGGRGIHLFLLWDEPQDAYSVREMLRQTLATCGLKNGTGGVVKHMVEIFPKQDSVPVDGFGNMFVLPFAGMSVPLDGEMRSCNRAEFTAAHWHLSDAVPILERPERSTPAPTNSSYAQVQSALAAIPNSNNEELDYDNWRNIIFAIHHATDGSDEGLALAHAFSSRSGKYDAEFLDGRVWPYVRSDRDSLITERSLFNTAASYGWEDPTVADEFDVLPDIAMPTSLRFEFVSAETFAAGSPPDWIIKGVLPAAGLAVVYGASGSGKTFMVLDMGAAIATGVAWRGSRTRQGQVAYIAAEGAGGFRNRLNAYAQHHSIQLADLDLKVLGDAPNFMKVDDVKDLIRGIQKLGAVSLVIVDTLSQVLPGANENAGEDVGKALAHCREIHKYTGAMVLLVHHSGKDETKGARGWSGLRAAADCEIEIMRSDDDRVATITKMKDGEDGAEYGFKLGVVDVGQDTDGDVITSCFVEHCEAVAKEKRKKEPGGIKERLIWRLAHDLAAMGDGTVPVEELLKAAILKMPRGESKDDKRRYVARRALEALADGGFLEVADDLVIVGRRSEEQ